MSAMDDIFPVDLKPERLLSRCLPGDWESKGYWTMLLIAAARSDWFARRISV